jgi:hypothetical protein
LAGVVLTFFLSTAPAPASPASPELERDFRELQALAAGCDDPRLNLSAPHVVVVEQESRRLASAMLRIEPARCAGIAAAARARLSSWVGNPERADADLELLALLHAAAGRGLGGPPDADLADRIARILWLFDEHPAALPRWSEAEWQAWLIRPETMALLEARVASPLRSSRPMRLLGELRLRRELPGYDPQRAISLLERPETSFAHDHRVRVARLLTDGDHLEPDYARAARPLLRSIRYADHSAASQAELVRIGRLAAAAARSQADRAEALRILWAAALDGRFDAAADRDALLAGLGALPTAALAPGDGERIAASVGREIPIFGISPPEDGSVEFEPIVIRALIGPDGQVAIAQIIQSSGSALHDRVALGVWAEHGGKADLSATARGRFVWTELPPIIPRYAIEPR